MNHDAAGVFKADTSPHLLKNYMESRSKKLSTGSTESLNSQEHGSLVGRELDAAVAELVMGFQWRVINRRRRNFHAPNGHIVALQEGKEISYTGYRTPNLPQYSTSIAAAMQVFEHFHEQHRMISINASGEDDGYWCVIYPLHDGPIIESDCYSTAAEAICRAALNAVNARE